MCKCGKWRLFAEKTSHEHSAPTEPTPQNYTIFRWRASMAQSGDIL